MVGTFDLEFVDVIVGMFGVFFESIKFAENIFSVVEPNDNLSLHRLKLNVHLLQVLHVLLQSHAPSNTAATISSSSSKR